jgi:hypothetical protein
MDTIKIVFTEKEIPPFGENLMTNSNCRKFSFSEDL